MTDIKKEKDAEEEKLTQAEEVPETEDGEQEAAVDVDTEKEGKEGENEEKKDGEEAEKEAEDTEKKEKKRFDFFKKFKKPTFTVNRTPTMDSFYCPEDRTQFRFVNCVFLNNFLTTSNLAPLMWIAARWHLCFCLCDLDSSKYFAIVP